MSSLPVDCPLGVGDSVDAYAGSYFPVVFVFGFPDLSVCEAFRVEAFDALTLAHNTHETVQAWNEDHLHWSSSRPCDLFIACLLQRPLMLWNLADQLEFEISADRVLAEWHLARKALDALQLFLRQLPLMDEWGLRWYPRFNLLSTASSSSSIANLSDLDDYDDDESDTDMFGQAPQGFGNDAIVVGARADIEDE